MILSVSRRTDVPCCFAPWFLHRIRSGSVLVRNPASPSQVRRVPLSPAGIDCIVFWSKDPAPLLPFLPELDCRGYRSYFQFTLTAYGRDLEPGLRDKPDLLETFRGLSSAVGAHRVVWRYDPIVFTARYSLPWHQSQFERLCRSLSGYTRTVTVSFLDGYSHVKKTGLDGPTLEEISELAPSLSEIARAYGLDIQSCAEPYDLTPYGIRRASCVDPSLLERLCGGPLLLRKDPGQRPACGCLESVDVGAYDTCRLGCVYCYANRGFCRRDAHDPTGELLSGSLGPEDAVRELPCVSSLSHQISLFSSGPA